MIGVIIYFVIGLSLICLWVYLDGRNKLSSDSVMILVCLSVIWPIFILTPILFLIRHFYKLGKKHSGFDISW